MPAMPSSVVIGPHTFSLVRSTPQVNAKQVAMHAPMWGFCDVGQQLIVIDDAPGLGEGAARETVLHECLHAIMDATGLSYAIGTEQKAYTEEALLQALDSALLGLLRDNPDLVAWLTSGS